MGKKKKPHERRETGDIPNKEPFVCLGNASDLTTGGPSFPNREMPGEKIDGFLRLHVRPVSGLQVHAAHTATLSTCATVGHCVERKKERGGARR